MRRFLLVVIACLCVSALAAQTSRYELNASHFHLTNHIQEGLNIKAFLAFMGDLLSRFALFAIPLQQQWSYRVDGENAPAYYLNTHAPLHYYSFTDAWTATAYRS